MLFQKLELFRKIWLLLRCCGRDLSAGYLKLVAWLINLDGREKECVAPSTEVSEAESVCWGEIHYSQAADGWILGLVWRPSLYKA